MRSLRLLGVPARDLEVDKRATVGPAAYDKERALHLERIRAALRSASATLILESRSTASSQIPSLPIVWSSARQKPIARQRAGA